MKKKKKKLTCCWRPEGPQVGLFFRLGCVVGLLSLFLPRSRRVGRPDSRASRPSTAAIAAQSSDPLPLFPFSSMSR
jgi:hypothetical protein